MSDHTCRGQKCGNCGMPLIHQVNRQMDESSNAIGHFVRSLTHDFGFTDIDGVSARGDTLRIIEHKWSASRISDSQASILRTLATLVDVGIEAGIVSPRSGVYVVRTSLDYARPYSFTAGQITHLHANPDADHQFQVDSYGLNMLCSARPITSAPEQMSFI